MDIRRNENCKAVFFIIGLLLAVALLTEVLTAENNTSPAEILAQTYFPSFFCTASNVDSMVERLETSLINCHDHYLTFRIKHRIAVLYFKTGKITDSVRRFLDIANSPHCPDIIRICSFNMIGQIQRLKGQHQEALRSFDKVIDYCKKQKMDDQISKLNDLLWLSIISRAQMYETLGNLQGSISEYNRLIKLLEEMADKETYDQYYPFAIDMILQLLIKNGNFDEYDELTSRLFFQHPDYNKLPIIKLENECVKLLHGSEVAINFEGNACETPAFAIDYLRTVKDVRKAADFTCKLEALCEEYKNNDWAFLLWYNYAWVLDGVGERDRAMRAFAKAGSSTDSDRVDHPASMNSIKNLLGDYSKVQYAIMCGEVSDYSSALRSLASVSERGSDSHLTGLSESVRKSIEILRRECPRNVYEDKQENK